MNLISIVFIFVDISVAHSVTAYGKYTVLIREILRCIFYP